MSVESKVYVKSDQYVGNDLQSYQDCGRRVEPSVDSEGGGCWSRIRVRMKDEKVQAQDSVPVTRGGEKKATTGFYLPMPLFVRLLGAYYSGSIGFLLMLYPALDPPPLLMIQLKSLHFS